MKKIFSTFWVLVKILIALLFSYIVMVIISHFSVYNSDDNYTFADSLKALFWEISSPAEFFIIFGIFIATTTLIALIINKIIKIIKFKNKLLSR